MNALTTIVDLSHEFGTTDYVRGGGGNTSFKNDHTMWIKPSGATLAGMTVESFLPMNRARIDALYAVATPDDPAAREALVKNMMQAAVEAETGRPSVEAPLHNVYAATYVVHTHPALVNGLTCARSGKQTCQRLFPEALWVDYIDPGYTLCMVVRERIQQYMATHGSEPALVFLKNHGLFVAADTAEDIRSHYARVMTTLKTEYQEADIPTELELETMDLSPESPATVRTIQALFRDDATHVTSSGRFTYAPGPLTPDHLVYARAYPFNYELSPPAAEAYRAKYGFAPKVVISGDRIYGIGTTQKNADLALEFAQDAALVMQLTEAFGGIQTMTDAQREFIENWEVESYRAQQV